MMAKNNPKKLRTDKRFSIFYVKAEQSFFASYIDKIFCFFEILLYNINITFRTK